jgi:hypothetical protein
MDAVDHARIETWEGLVARKRQLLGDIASGKKSRSPADIERIRREADQLETLIAFYRTSLGSRAA